MPEGASARARLPHPITFVTRILEQWKDVADLELPPCPDAVSDRLRGGYNGWIIQTWLVLKRRGHDVALRDRFPPGGLCVAHCDHVGRADGAHRSFVVAVRADRPPALLCDHEIVQNPAGEGPRSHFVPYWPQPGLRPRDLERGDRVERLGFIGRDRNLAEPFKSASFRAALLDLGVELVIQEDDWRDYSRLDCVLAVRRGRPRFLGIKPPSKLTNAWLAGCPALLGAEPAYEALRRCELDYTTVTSPEDVLQALKRLKREPGLYRAIVNHGLERAREFDRDHVAQRWEQVLGGPVADDFERWRRTRGGVRGGLRAARFAGLAAWQSVRPNLYRR